MRFQEAWVDMYSQGIFEYAPWYQCLGNHDVVKGQNGVDFQTKVLPYYDDRWYFVSTRLPLNDRTLLPERWARPKRASEVPKLMSMIRRELKVFHTTPTT